MACGPVTPRRRPRRVSRPTRACGRSLIPFSPPTSIAIPEAVTQYGVPGRRQDRLTDNSLEAQKAWDAREDAWLAELKQIDPATIASPLLRATYAIVRQTIERAAAKRVCRDELWTVSQMTGWQVNDGYLVTIQPVGTDGGAPGCARALAHAAEVHRHRNRQPARGHQARIHRAEAERADRDRPGAEPWPPRRSKIRRFIRRRSETRRSGVPKAVRRARLRPDQPRGETVRGLPREGVSARRRARRSPSPPTRTAPPVTTPACCITARRRRRRRRCTRSAWSRTRS